MDWLPEPFWPVMMGLAGALTITGALVGRGAWIVPALALGGYVATRIVVESISATSAWDEILVCAVWLCVSGLMMYAKAWVPGALYALSAMTYPAFVVFGLHIGWLSLPNIIAEVFAILALVFIGGSIGGTFLRPRPGRHRHRSDSRLASHSLGMAPNNRGDVQGSE